MTEAEKKLRQEWRTPDDFFRVLDDEFHFDIDVCANLENRKCGDYISRERNALADDCEWFNIRHRSAFCNPGFNNILPWIHKAYEETRKKPNSVAVVLGLCAPSAAWFQYAVEVAEEVRLLRPRVQYFLLGVKNSSNPRECAMFIFRDGLGINDNQRIVHWNWKPKP